ncbi:IS1634 family transposase [Candidatus Parcubacteria bacterium]|nr:IS1634 family transposase [Candidatus Parcubacteria bacterium]
MHGANEEAVNMFLRETVIKKASGEYRYWRLVKTYWDKVKKKVRHKTIKQLGRLKPNEIAFFKDSLAGKAGKRFSWAELTCKKSFEYLAVAILHRIWKYWGLDALMEDKTIEALTINRSLSPESDYQVSRWYEETILPRILNLNLNPTKIYRTLDTIPALTSKIQQHLYAKINSLGLDDYELVFYDITSSYFQQSNSDLARYGLSRDHRGDKKQILLALAVTKKGFPFYWQVLEGNTADTKTVQEFVDELKRLFNIKHACLVMDKGMVSITNIEKIQTENFNYCVTLRRNSIAKLKGVPWNYLRSINENNVENKKDYFIRHSKRAYYKELPSCENKRYILCFNPEKFLTERLCRLDKIASIVKYLDQKNQQLSKALGRRHRELLREELTRYLEKRSASNLFSFRLIAKEKTFRISYKVLKKAVADAARLDGVYCLMTNLKTASPKELIDAYRGRMEIERSFHQLKSFCEIRPIYHHNEDRIKAHVTVCVLAYLLNNTVMHLTRQKKDFEELTAQSIYNYLKSCKLVELSASGEQRLKLTVPTDEQIQLTKILADKSLLEEEGIQQLLPASTGAK